MSKHLSPAYQLYSAREDASNDLEGVWTSFPAWATRGWNLRDF